MVDRPGGFDDIEIELTEVSQPEHVVVNNVRPKGAHIGQAQSSEVDVYIESEVARSAWNHVLFNTREERGGLLLGVLEEDSGLYVRVNAELQARYTSCSLGSLTFTHETWADFASRITSEHSDKKIVGWYHSHPGHGVFMSRFDRFIHLNFFKSPWQCAWVIDPINKQDGLFQLANGQLQKTGYYITGKQAVDYIGGSTQVEDEVCLIDNTMSLDFANRLDEAFNALLMDTSSTLHKLGDFIEQYTLNRKSTGSKLGQHFSGEG